jgi:hypothetical protein
VPLLTAALVAVLAVCAAALWALVRLLGSIPDTREGALRNRTLQLLASFAPAAADAAGDPKALLAWHPVAAAARKLFADEFAAIDRAAGSTFPFSEDQIQAAHARWTADWLAWERSHDAEYKLKAQAAEAELSPAGGSALARARLDAVEREKLERYQRRYEEYVRVAKALQALLPR